MALASTLDSWGMSSGSSSAQAGSLPLSHTRPELPSQTEGCDRATGWVQRASLSICCLLLSVGQLGCSDGSDPSDPATGYPEEKTTEHVQIRSDWGHYEFANTAAAASKPDWLRTCRTEQVVGKVCMLWSCEESHVSQISSTSVRELAGKRQS